MSIQELLQRIKRGVNYSLGRWGHGVLIALVALACFGLGRLSALLENQGQISFREAPVAITPLGPSGQFVADSRNQLYYFPWCSGAQQTPEMYQVWFQSENAAQKAGFAPAKNCRGLIAE